MSKARQQILTTDFYGENTAWSKIDMVHCEELQLRSARYDWQIKPHRHRDLMQVFYVLQGEGTAQADQTPLSLQAGDILTIPEDCVHTFRWEPGSNGFVLFMAHPLLSRIEQSLGRLDWFHGGASLFRTLQQQSVITPLFSLLNHEFQHPSTQRELMLENLTSSICLSIHRLHLQYHAPQEQRSRSHRLVQHFIELVDGHYSQHHEVQWYADRLAITPAHLNSLCRNQRQQSALEIIHTRLVTEAQRQLIYSGESAAAIAESLGFSDPAYFNRFFKRLTGTTPNAYRKLKPGTGD